MMCAPVDGPLPACVLCCVRLQVVIGSRDTVYMVMEYVEHDLKYVLELQKAKKAQPFSIGQVRQAPGICGDGAPAGHGRCGAVNVHWHASRYGWPQRPQVLSL